MTITAGTLRNGGTIMRLDLHTTGWLHRQGEDQQALSNLDSAIGQASLPY